MPYIVLAYIALAYIVMACIVTACIIVAYIVMAYVVMAWVRYIVRPLSIEMHTCWPVALTEGRASLHLAKKKQECNQDS